MKIKVLFLFLSFALSLSSIAQKDTSVVIPKDYKNLVRINLTPTLVLGPGSYAAGYERMVKPNQSISVNFGFLQMPKFFSNVLDTLQIDRHTNRRGFSFAADYRFYLTKRNKYPAPDGLYVGPYFTVYHFDTRSNVNIYNDGTLRSNFYVDSDFWFLMAGAELGYQFTLGPKRRWTLDLILVGPSIRYDNLKIKVSADVDGEIDDEYLQGVFDALVAVIPGFKELAEKGEISTDGVSSGFGGGYRYVVQVGFRF